MSASRATRPTTRSEYIASPGRSSPITDRDRPVALIVPVRGNDRDVVPRDPVRPFSRVRRKRFKPADWPIGSTELLLEERQGR